MVLGMWRRHFVYRGRSVFIFLLEIPFGHIRPSPLTNQPNSGTFGGDHRSQLKLFIFSFTTKPSPLRNIASISTPSPLSESRSVTVDSLSLTARPLRNRNRTS
ncbi:hypothetical protein ES319_D06G150100v1 [Gossypium barbadense]|uniref:Uncharacterized protein n=2 Tax=Gossypium TaxID=3633 RepID=A0A5J5R2N7_GOSBA|nr:hypothetical protein ES319_D06G150100v1 [Gossypium barbadense]TYG65124.1 hypothetical protein ES288_D06G160400v1 [Gossypium darwinii]